MTPFLVPLATAVLIVAVTTAVLTRRDRRRMTAGTGGLSSETTACESHETHWAHAPGKEGSP
jgi:hypothetical protein